MVKVKLEEITALWMVFWLKGFIISSKILNKLKKNMRDTIIYLNCLVFPTELNKETASSFLRFICAK